jgi:predicted nuclease with RNAse H fold
LELSTASTEDGKRRVDVRSLGLDLAGSEKRDSGLAVLDEELSCWAFTVRLDSEIIRLAEDLRPDIVVIDAPLSLPRGRKSIEDKIGRAHV